MKLGAMSEADLGSLIEDRIERTATDYSEMPTDIFLDLLW
jgi:hypothetical protein